MGSDCPARVYALRLALHAHVYGRFTLIWEIAKVPSEAQGAAIMM